MKNLNDIAEYANNSYNDANCKYDNKDYSVHINYVKSGLYKYRNIFTNADDFNITLASIDCHDLIEDAKQTYGDILINTESKDVADITLAVTDTPAINRFMRHLLTMPRTIQDYRAIIVKMCDIRGNAMYSKETGSTMYQKYCLEYSYRKPIFQIALNWYKEKLNQHILIEFWNELDEIHNTI